MNFTLRFVLLTGLLALWSCHQSPSADNPDLLLTNGNFYTLDEQQPSVQAIAIRDGVILKMGTNEEILALKGPETEVIDLEGHFAMPGFIEGHGHLSSLGSSLINLNLSKAKNWDEIVASVAEKVKAAKPGEWIIGRGWHQEKWDKVPEPQVLGYPYHDALSAISPDNPVLLGHASGHSLFANKAAMDLAGITRETPNPSGGAIVRNTNGEAIGVFEENGMDAIWDAYNHYLETQPEAERKETWLKGVQLAQEDCLKKGITSFEDAGSSYEEIERYKELADNGKLDLRLWVMLREPYGQIKEHINGLPIIDAGGKYFTCRAIKQMVDGALGSYGAWLLKPYDDKPTATGQNTTEIAEIGKVAELAADRQIQLCVHAIGDRANREVLNLFEDTFKKKGGPTDLRWRIEHSQHVDPADIPRFKQLGVIASMQGIHCTSDAPFVVKRLGETRARQGAYAWRSLLDAGAVVTNGTDTPVEDVDPIPCFYATVTRKRVDTGLEFFPEQRMTRAEAVKSYTLSNAYAAFQENDKGSLTPGKLADIVVLSNDLLKCKDEEILQTQVLITLIGGKVKYKK